MTDRSPRRSPPAEVPLDPLLSDEPTIELVIRARGGDRLAVEALLQRCLPALTRWAHGRLPAAARGAIDTGDLVQEAVLHALQRLDVFEPRHVGAMQAYLRQSVINRIRDEVRRIARHPAAVPIGEEHPSDATSPLESAIQTESYERYRRALGALKPREREMIVARVEVQWSLAEIAQRFGLRSVDAARMAVSRALKRLSSQMRPQD
ncbi:MAG: sigma-70 family RNA polymerase sigma factor [Acidobacteria bacterium]|nr:sigma-70 family RNA polymerase sigma factor [Acidobacteriota bacterium]